MFIRNAALLALPLAVMAMPQYEEAAHTTTTSTLIVTVPCGECYATAPVAPVYPTETPVAIPVVETPAAPVYPTEAPVAVPVVETPAAPVYPTEAPVVVPVVETPVAPVYPTETPVVVAPVEVPGTVTGTAIPVVVPVVSAAPSSSVVASGAPYPTGGYNATVPIGTGVPVAPIGTAPIIGTAISSTKASSTKAASSTSATPTPVSSAPAESDHPAPVSGAAALGVSMFAGLAALFAALL